MSILETIDFKTATPEQIEAYAAASREAEAQARAELEQRQAKQHEALAGVQSEWRRDVIERHTDLDAKLVDEGQQQGEKFRAAVHAGDLSAALAAWIAQRASRDAQRLIRNAATNAETAERTGAHVLPDDMRYYEPDLLNRLEAEAETVAAQLAEETARALIGELPAEVPASTSKRKRA